MTHIWIVTTGWDYESTCGMTFAFDNEVSARTVAHEIDTARMKYEAALIPSDKYVLEATGQKIPIADHTVIQGPIQVLS